MTCRKAPYRSRDRRNRKGSGVMENLDKALRWGRLAEGTWGPDLVVEIKRLRAIERRAIDALRGNASETDEYERGWLDACAEILGKRS